MFSWLMDHVFDRAGYRAFKEECRRMDENSRKLAVLDARIREAFTPEEWRETEERCMRKLSQMGC